MNIYFLWKRPSPIYLITAETGGVRPQRGGLGACVDRGLEALRSQEARGRAGAGNWEGSLGSFRVEMWEGAAGHEEPSWEQVLLQRWAGVRAASAGTLGGQARNRVCCWQHGSWVLQTWGKAGQLGWSPGPGLWTNPYLCFLICKMGLRLPSGCSQGPARQAHTCCTWQNLTDGIFPHV